MPPKKQRSISSRSDQQPFMVNLEMEVEEEMEDDINNNEVISSTEESSSSSSSDYSNSLETNSTDACSPSPPSTTSTSTSSSSSSSPPSFISIPSTAIKSDDIIPAISIISPTPTEPKEVLRTGLGAGAAPRFAFPSNKSADQPKPKSLFEIGDEESEDSTTENHNRTLNLTETEDGENGAENPKISKSFESRCCGNGCTKIGENQKNSHRRRSPSLSTLSSDDSTSPGENGDQTGSKLECICLEMCPITTTETKRKTSAEDQDGEEEVENAPHHDDLTTEEKEEKEKEEPGRLLTTTAHTHRRNRSTHHRHHYHHRYHQHHQHPPPTPLPLLCNQQVSLYGPEQQSPAGAFVGSEQQQQLFSSKESLSSTSSAAAAAAHQQHHQHQQKPAPQSATMPMAINSMDKCSKLWRNDPTEPFPAKARPKPIKFEIPSAAKTMASYFRLPSPVSPAVSAGQQTPQTGGLYSIGSEPIINHGFEPEEEEEEEVSPGRGRRPLATLQVSQTLPPSASLASFSSVAAHSNLSSPEASRTPFSPNIGGAQHSPAAPAMTNFVPIYISAKDLEAAFLGGGSNTDQASGGPPPQYTSAEQLQQKKKVVQLANLSATPSAYNSLNAKHKNSAVKRTKSFQERIQRALWGGTNGEGDGGGDPLPPPKAALCARMSILGKPLKQPRNRSLHLMRQRVWLYNFLQRPRGVLAYAYHLAVAITIILNLLFFALSTVSYLEPQSMNALRALDIIILSILTLELVALCWASSCVGKYQGWQGKFRFIFLSPFRLLDLLIIGVTAVVVWTCWLNSHQDYLQWLRCGMIFQILRLENRFKPWRMLSSVLWIERKHLLITVYMGFLILVTISYVVFFLEQEDPETLFTNIPVSLYWGVITVCTIGYGDMAPKTTAGRTVGALLAICGAVIYAIPAGIIATGLALKVQERNREKHINKRRIPAVRLIQCAWRCYAASANSTSSVTWWVAQKAVASGGNRGGGGGFHRKLMDMYNGSQFSLMEDHHQHHSDHHHNDHHQHNNHSTAASKQNSHSDLHALNLESGGGGGGGILSGAQKNAVRFIRAAQYEVALREFKNAFKPYDIKDVLQQYSEGHADVVGRVRCMQSGINAVHVALGGVMKMMAEMQHRQTEKIDRLEATVERLLRRLQEAEGDGGGGGDGHQGGDGNGHHPHHPPNSPYHSYSETSTIYARTPTLAQQSLHPPPPPPPPPPAPPTSSKEDEENSFNEVRTRHQNQQQQQQQPPHHHSRNNSS